MQDAPSGAPAERAHSAGHPAAGSAGAIWHFDPFELRANERLLLRRGEPARLGGRAFDLLVALVERRDRVVPKSELLDLVWPRLVVEENNLQVHVLALRKLLGPQAIATVPGRGYRFTLPVTVEGRDGGVQAVSGDDASGLPRAAGVRTNLPHWQPPLHGREDALQALDACLDAHSWVTVVGPAGIGKTRLAQAAAGKRAAEMPGGVWWADLAALTDPALVPSTIALAMGVRLDGARDLTAALAAHMCAQATLLVLDNVEHLCAGVAVFLAELRPLAGALHLLLTSQEVLHGTDEQVFRVEPLSLPIDDTMAAAEASGAVQLFAARARAADRHFSLNSQNQAAVADICRRLDGIPLAIELAAARLPLLGVDGLRARMDQRFQLLTVGDRAAARRHRTLREAVQWSHQLLTAEEQAVFRRLGVFAGGFTLAAALAVAEDKQAIDPWDVLEHLGRLVDKSLVAAEGDAMPRYRLLETLRLFALEKLIEHGEADAVRTAHRAHFVAVAEAAHDAMQRGRPGGLPSLDAERDNLFLAVSWKRDDEGGQQGLRLAEALDPYWLSRGMLSFGLDQCRSALAHPGVQEWTPTRCRVELHAAGFCSLAGRLGEALQHATHALNMARSLADDACLSFALVMLGQIHEQSGNLVEAQRHGEEGLQRARQTTDPWTLRRALMFLGSVHDRCGHRDMSMEMEEEGLALSQASGLVRFQAEHHLNLAWMHCEREHAEAARDHLGEVAKLLPQMDSEYYGVEVVRTAASWAAFTHRHEQALHCFSAHAAQVLRIGLSDPLESWEAAHRQRAAAGVDAATRERAERLGASWTYDEALAAAGRLLSTPP